MCGRFSLFAPPEDVESRFDAEFAFEFEPTYNAAPGQALPVVTNESPGTIQAFEWGLVPSWADDRSDFEFINARAETVAEKSSFADAYERRRCLVPADGFYEWVDREGGKQPYRVTLSDDEGLFAMAGLWERWTPSTQTGLGDFGGGTGGSDGVEGTGDGDGVEGTGDGDGVEGTGDGDGPIADPDPVETFTVVTTEPNDVVADLHHRMAVVLSPDEEGTWLHGDPEEVADLLDPHPADRMRAYPVSTAVNDPANDSPALVEEVEAGN